MANVTNHYEGETISLGTDYVEKLSSGNLFRQISDVFFRRQNKDEQITFPGNKQVLFRREAGNDPILSIRFKTNDGTIIIECKARDHGAAEPSSISAYESKSISNSSSSIKEFREIQAATAVDKLKQVINKQVSRLGTLVIKRKVTTESVPVNLPEVTKVPKPDNYSLAARLESIGFRPRPKGSFSAENSLKGQTLLTIQLYPEQGYCNDTLYLLVNDDQVPSIKQQVAKVLGDVRGKAVTQEVVLRDGQTESHTGVSTEQPKLPAVVSAGANKYAIGSRLEGLGFRIMRELLPTPTEGQTLLTIKPFRSDVADTFFLVADNSQVESITGQVASVFQEAKIEANIEAIPGTSPSPSTSSVGTAVVETEKPSVTIPSPAPGVISVNQKVLASLNPQKVLQTLGDYVFGRTPTLSNQVRTAGGVIIDMIRGEPDTLRIVVPAAPESERYGPTIIRVTPEGPYSAQVQAWESYHPLEGGTGRFYAMRNLEQAIDRLKKALLRECESGKLTLTEVAEAERLSIEVTRAKTAIGALDYYDVRLAKTGVQVEGSPVLGKGAGEVRVSPAGESNPVPAWLKLNLEVSKLLELGFNIVAEPKDLSAAEGKTVVMIQPYPSTPDYSYIFYRVVDNSELDAIKQRLNRIFPDVDVSEIRGDSSNQRVTAATDTRPVTERPVTETASQPPDRAAGGFSNAHNRLGDPTRVRARRDYERRVVDFSRKVRRARGGESIVMVKGAVKLPAAPKIVVESSPTATVATVETPKLVETKPPVSRLAEFTSRVKSAARTGLSVTGELTGRLASLVSSTAKLPAVRVVTQGLRGIEQGFSAWFGNLSAMPAFTDQAEKLPKAGATVVEVGILATLASAASALVKSLGGVKAVPSAVEYSAAEAADAAARTVRNAPGQAARAAANSARAVSHGARAAVHGARAVSHAATSVGARVVHAAPVVARTAVKAAPGASILGGTVVAVARTNNEVYQSYRESVTNFYSNLAYPSLYEQARREVVGNPSALKRVMQWAGLTGENEIARQARTRHRYQQLVAAHIIELKAKGLPPEFEAAYKQPSIY